MINFFVLPNLFILFSANEEESHQKCRNFKNFMSFLTLFSYKYPDDITNVDVHIWWSMVLLMCSKMLLPLILWQTYLYKCILRNFFNNKNSKKNKIILILHMFIIFLPRYVNIHIPLCKMLLKVL